MQEYLFQILDKDYKIVAESAADALAFMNNKIMPELNLGPYTWFGTTDRAWRIGLKEDADSFSLYD